MSVKSKTKLSPDISTQRYLPFSEIRDNILIMKDWSARLVLRCSTINFLLKSMEEQDSIIISYQRFLNSLEFPVQIIVRSTKLDIDSYISELNGLAVNHVNEKLQSQTYDYIEYLKKLIEVAQIMKKEFYLVVPYDNFADTSVRDISLVGSIKSFMASINWGVDKSQIRRNIKSFEKNKKALYSRSGMVKTALENIWIRAQELDKKDLIELVFEYYNPSMGTLKKYDELSNSDLL